MSTHRAIEAVSLTLTQLLRTRVSHELPGGQVSLMPVDVARKDRSKTQLNLFLYRTSVNVGWANTDLPLQTRTGETGRPPLALDLHYLLTAYGADDRDDLAHRVLGLAMGTLQDHPVLGRAELAVPESGLAAQIERIRIAPQPLSLDEIARLWMTFKAEYRLSAGYWVSVVLIDSRLSASTPLPVLQRGEQDRGALVGATAEAPFPTLTGLRPPEHLTDLRPGETLTLLGAHLDTGEVLVRFRHVGLDRTVDVPPGPDGLAYDSAAVVLDPVGDWDWPAGFYGVALRAGGPDGPTGHALGIAVAPGVVDIVPSPAELDADGRVVLTVRCSPDVRPGQRVALLLDQHELPPAPIDQPTGRLSVPVRGVPPGTYRARLRVDGADSRFVDHSGAHPVFTGPTLELRRAGG